MASSRRTAQSAARAVEPHGTKRIRFGEAFDREACDARGCGEPFDAGIAVAARHDELRQFILAQSFNLAKAEAYGVFAVRSLFQRAIPCAVIDVRLSHLDAVLARVAYELGRLVEAHRLAVENGGAEDVRIVALDPGGGVDEQREACGVAFRKTIFAKTLDLAEAAFGKRAVIAAAGHAGDEFVTEQMDVPVMAEGRHGAPQPIRLVGRELRGRDGDLHCLFLEQRHPQGPFQDRFQLVGGPMRGVGRGIIRFLDVIASAQIGMHHVALNRTGAHDRHFDDEVVETLRLEARQHRHLGAALDLEHADRVGVREHPIDLVVVRGQGGERVILAIMPFQKIKPAPDATQHAEREHVDFHEAERIDVVLVPFDEGALVHGGIADRHRLVEPLAGEHEAADMLGKVTREADEFAGERDGLPDCRIGGIESRLADMIIRQSVAVTPYRFGERGGYIRRQSQNLADFADRPA
jgi:hypothetical protein